MRHRAMQRTWLEVDLDTVLSNYHYAISKLHDDTNFITVVKADAYGHGSPAFVKLLEAEKQLFAFAVATIDEAIQLRRLGIKKRILVLGYVAPELAGEICEHELTVPLVSLNHAQKMSAAAVEAGCTVCAHIKIDSGMCRLGLVNHDASDLERTLADAEAILALPNLAVDGIFTHFATSGWEDSTHSDTQFKNFQIVLDGLEEKGHRLPYAHCCNSGAIAFHPEYELHAVRSGSLHYGFQPSPTRPIKEIRSPLSMRSRIAQVKELRAGASIGYDRTYVVEGSMTMGVVPVGYADGVPFEMSNAGCVLVNGRRAPVVGKICMDQLMIDLTNIPDVEEGQICTIFGADNGTELDVFAMCSEIKAHPAQFLCNITGRVPRVYFQNGEIVGAQTGILDQTPDAFHK